MKQLNMQRQNAIPQSSRPGLQPSEVTVKRLVAEETLEVLSFLQRRPLHTVAMVSFIRDNGLVSPLNRGTFYGCRNHLGQLEGVALIGHATLLETTTDRALEAFAEIARTCDNGHMIMGEELRVKEFWKHYAEAGNQPRLVARELLLESHGGADTSDSAPGIRLATLADLELIVPVHAQLAFDESGINPLDVDPAGFRQRCARRIELGRVWVVVENGELLFKADIQSETPEVRYLEGIWVNPAYRHQGHGLRCLAKLQNSLLKKAGSLCLLVNENNKTAVDFYRKAGFQLTGTYETVFLDRPLVTDFVC